jgi:4,5-dihydroxyphthalate decarboxylase
MSAQTVTSLKAALGDYPHTLALKQRQLASPSVTFDFSDVQPVFKVFGAMVRDCAFDVSELAIVTYLQAKSFGKPLVLLPAVMMGRFQHHCMFYNAERTRLAPSDLPGRRVGVRSYAQTTGAWLRGHLQNDFGVDPAAIRWVTFEDAHVAEFRDPPGVERAAAGRNMTAMLLDGELDAAIFGAELPQDKRLQCVIPDADSAARKWHAQHRAVPINHMVVVRQELARSSPAVVREVYRLLLQSKTAAVTPAAGGLDPIPFGFKACRAALEVIIAYCVQQKLIPRPFAVEELFDETTLALGG